MNKTIIGPQTQVSDLIHGMKYRERGEDFRELCNRVAFALRDNDEHYKQIREIILHLRFMWAGRVQNAMGSTRQTTPWNCFVSGTIADSYTDKVGTEGSIMHRAHEAAATMRMGGGIGYDFSTLRPRGFRVGRIGSNSTGPISFMQIFDAVGLVTSSSGHRRGAQMGILRVDHPDIEEFVRAKQNTTALRGFNISVAVTDEFMDAVQNNKSFKLRWGDYVVNEIDAALLWEKIMRSTWDWGEPGVFFVDTVNRMNNLWYEEIIAATNPCGEQPLPPYGACLLGSFNLTKYVERGGSGITPHWVFDWDLFKSDIPIVVRATDNIIDRGRYPLPQQAAEGKNKRRMGLGIMGLANAAEALGFPYGSPSFLQFENQVLEVLVNECYRASVMLAKEKGAFTLFNEEKYSQGKFIQTLPEDIRDGIKKYGIRNSHLTSIAPTGTISLSCDNISSGIEPVFAYESERKVNTPDEGEKTFVLEDYGVKFFGVRGKRTREVKAQEHVNVLCTAQKYMDSAVSKTINMDNTMPWSDFVNIYFDAWKGGAKGCTTFNKDGKRMAMMAEVEDGMSCVINPETGERDCS